MFLTIGPFDQVESPLQLLHLVIRKELSSPAPKETVEPTERGSAAADPASGRHAAASWMRAPIRSFACQPESGWKVCRMR